MIPPTRPDVSPVTRGTGTIAPRAGSGRARDVLHPAPVRASSAPTKPASLGQGVEVGEGGARTGLADEVADQGDRAEVGVGDAQAGGVAQEVEDGPPVDRPADAEAEGLEEVVEPPSPVPEGADV